MAEGSTRPDEVFNAARRLDEPAARRAYLDRACGEDTGLRRQVEALLGAYAEADSFLSVPAAAAGMGLGLSPTLDQSADAAAQEGPGSVVGPYKLLEQIGEGGMGVVFLAEQQRPVRRKVALKVVKPGMDSRQVLARFEAERQALAIMDHPNIAKVFDGGITDAGRPYFVMELVKGEPITDFCDRNRLPPRERLELFTQVCQAVQHAHQKGIIHRDIKPSNVLVSLHETTPVVQVIDFGIAKALGQELTDKTLFTGSGQVVGTPLYMSPEQAGHGGAVFVDTRTDVYSLGVLLYELLTGSTPFDKERFHKAAYEEIRRIIREEEPPRPSTRLSESKASLPSISARRRTEPAKLTRLVRGELDWIVMKALEKDLGRRYETATGFASDVRRYLENEAVLACPPSAVYRLKKFARRHRGGVAVAALVLPLLVLLGSGAGWAVRDRAARQGRLAAQVDLILDEVEQLERGQRWAEALAAARRAHAAVASGDADAATEGRVGDRLAQLQFIDRLERVRMRLATWRQAAFDAEGGDRDYGRAFRDYGVDVDALPVETSVARLRARPELTLPIAAALDYWTHARRRVSRLHSADWARLAAVAGGIDPDPLRNRLRSTAGLADAQSRDDLRLLAESIDIRAQHPVTLAIVTSRLAQFQSADSAIRFLRDARRAHPEDFWLNYDLAYRLAAQKDFEGAVRFYTAAVSIRPDAAAAQNSLGFALVGQGKVDEGVEACRKAIELDPGDSWCYDNLGIALRRQKKLDEAVAAHRRAIELAPRHAAGYSNLGVALTDQKKLDEAVAAHRKAIELDPRDARVYSNYGAALRRQGKLDEAIAAQRQAIRLDPTFPAAYTNLGVALADQKKLDEAVAAHRKAIELDPREPVTYVNLGFALRRQKKLDAAAAAQRKAIELDPGHTNAYVNLAAVLREQKKLDEAITASRKAIELDPAFAGAYVGLGYALKDQKKPEEAVAAYRKAFEVDPEYGDAHQALGLALLDQGRVDEAVAAHRKATQLDPKSAAAFSNFGLALRRQKKPEEALVAYRRAIELDPQLAAAYANLSVLLGEQKKLDEAVVVAQKAVDLEPDDAGVHGNLGVLLIDQGHDFGRAVACLRRAIDLDPGFADAYSDLGNALRLQGKLEEAVAACQKAIKLDAKHAAAYNNLGVALCAQKRLEEAARALRTAIELGGKANAYTSLGNVLADQQDLDGAVAAYRKAIELEPGLAAAYHNLGHALMRLNKLDEAIAAYRKSIELDPKMAVAYGNLANALANQGKLDEAVGAMRRMIEVEPRNAAAHYNLGQIIQRQGKVDAAIAHFREALQLDPKLAIAHTGLGIALQSQGRLDEAIEAYKTAIGLDPNDAMAHNNAAWLLATSADPRLRDPALAVTLAKRAVELNPTDPGLPNTLGIAQYRAGDWNAAIAALENSVRLRQGGDGFDWFFLAMAHWQSGNKEEARRWYDKAAEWVKQREPHNKELAPFRLEAAGLLGVTDTDHPAPTTAPAAQHPARTPK